MSNFRVFPYLIGKIGFEGARTMNSKRIEEWKKRRREEEKEKKMHGFGEQKTYAAAQAAANGKIEAHHAPLWTVVKKEKAEKPAAS